ncbi:M4 family metallopeptidase [Herbaspirillum sp.]|uniref:M4 family metallopeptidase n=1 Tax=Herbaspirillum sp. TaxID=1890675 RepID=UPI001B03DE96|nr:M4 family metallopeptidase [Herbaspirillum sp.]MBO9537287.1 M4 family metallopeptidase [Herbaspirillum sp.]
MSYPYYFIPPYLLERLSVHPAPELSHGAAQTLLLDQQVRTERAQFAGAAIARQQRARRTVTLKRSIYDAKNGTALPGTLIRSEGKAVSGDAAADEAYDHMGTTWQMFHDVYERNSIDDAGLPLVGSVHYGKDYDNAFWNGSQMVFGDGDGRIFKRFTIALDVIAHELAHGVTASEGGLAYQNQSGALNESLSDVFGILAKQFHLRQTADQSDWLIGAGLFLPGINARGLRSMAEPGSAYDDPVLGKDPQPGHMRDYVDTEQDNGGVHINSGIPNHAFYLAATELGGHAWERAGRVWYDTLRHHRLRPDADFAEFAGLSMETAAAQGKDVAAAVRSAWRGVGVLHD